MEIQIYAQKLLYLNYLMVKRLETVFLVNGEHAEGAWRDF